MARYKRCATCEKFTLNVDTDVCENPACQASSVELGVNPPGNHKPPATKPEVGQEGGDQESPYEYLLRSLVSRLRSHWNNVSGWSVLPVQGRNADGSSSSRPPTSAAASHR